MNDSALVSLARAGDQDAFRQLVDEHFRSCLRYARRVLTDPEGAEDVLQETFFRAYQALPRYREEAQFHAWLFQILVNQCRMANRGNRRWTQRFIRDERAIDHAAESAATEESKGDALYAALAALDERSREAMLLKHGEGMGYKDMARLTGESESALKMRVKRARDVMRRLIAPTRVGER
ncbi:MAG: sigma-70 family RNA polymerase sigma factor [Gemmatimonadaceae bacterium]